MPRPLLLVTNDLGPRAGGIETFILGLLEQLPGERIVIYTSSQPGAAEFDQELMRRRGILVIRDRAKVLLPTPLVNRRVVKVMKTYGSTTIWFGAATPLAWMAAKLKRAGATRLITLTHGHEVWWAKIFPFSWIMRKIGNSLDVVTYLGDFTRGAISPALGKSPELVRIAPGIDLSHFTPGAKDPELMSKYHLEGRKIIISVGRLVHRKGQDRLIQAMPSILRTIPTATLLFVGEGPYKAELEKLVAKYQLSQSVQFIGRLKYPELPLHIRLGDVFAMPSRSRFFGLEVEGLGIVYLEASACGLPVIAGKSGGAPDAVIESETGLLVDGTNVSEIAAAAIELLSDPERAKGMGANGRAWVEKEWGWKLWGSKFIELLQIQ